MNKQLFVPRTGIEPALPCDNQILSEFLAFLSLSLIISYLLLVTGFQRLYAIAVIFVFRENCRFTLGLPANHLQIFDVKMIG